MSRAGGPEAPRVSGPETADLAAPSREPMSETKMAEIDAKVAAARQALRPAAASSAVASEPPETIGAMEDAAACRRAIARMFDGNVEVSALTRRISVTRLPVADAARRFEAPLILATALHSVCGRDADLASTLLSVAQSSRRPLTPLRRQLAELHRVLASTNAGMGVLCHLEGAHDPEHAERLSDVMRLTLDLSRLGLEPDGPELHEDLMRRVDRLMSDDERLQRPIGAQDDPPQQLLLQAFLHAGARLERRLPRSITWNNAYVAWKKGGFTRSGEGSSFNLAIARLNKFGVYVRRANHGPRTAANLAREAAHMLVRPFGKYKNPLSRMRYGGMGGTLSTLDDEALQFRKALDGAIDPLVEYGRRLAANPAVQRDPARFARTLARVATLEQWKTHGRIDVPVDAHDVLQRADAMRRELEEVRRRSLGAYATVELDMRRVLRDIGGSAMLRRTGANRPLPAKRNGMKLQLELLERWGDEAINEVMMGHAVRGAVGLLPRLDRGRLNVGDAQSIAGVRDESIALFQWRDLYNIVAARTPRKGPNTGHQYKIALKAAKACYESMTHFYDGGGGGFNLSAVLGLKAGHGAAIVPSLRAEKTRLAEFTVGVGPTGGRLFVGKRRLKSLAAGMTGAFGYSIPGGVLAAFMEVSLGRDSNDGEGACIATRGANGKTERVVDFMFKQAQRERTDQQFWDEFVREFGDDPDVTVSWNAEHANTTTGVVGGGVTARANVGGGVSVGPQLSADLRFVDERVGRRTGSNVGDVPFELRARRVAVSGTATLAMATPSKPLSGPVIDSLLNVIPLLGIGGERVLSGTGGVARIGRTSKGTLDPRMCQRERQVRSPNDMLKLVNARREVWEAAMQGARAEGMSEAELQPRARLDAFLRNIQALTVQGQADDHHRQGNRTFGEFTSLKPEVAARIDACEARLVTLLGGGDIAERPSALAYADHVECDRLMVEMDRMLDDDESWAPVSLYAFETNVKASAGLDLGLKLGSRGEAGANRLLALLLPGKPDLNAED